VRSAVPVVTTVLLSSLLAAGCGHGPGVANSRAPSSTPDPTGLRALIVVPAGYVERPSTDPREQSGPFDSQSYLAHFSGLPPQDKALLLNADFTEGYHAFRTSPDRRKQVTVDLFRAGSGPKALTLQHGFWAEDDHSRTFPVPGVPGALSDAHVVVTGDRGRSVAAAEVSFVVGGLLVDIDIREFGEVGSDLVPDTTLAAFFAKQQKTRLTR
jgi:hypothetical protein